MKKCGDFNGRTVAGTACKYGAGMGTGHVGEGRCKHHEGKALPRGKPTKLVPETVTKIITSIRLGNYAGRSAEAAGISEATFQNWMRTARHELELDEKDRDPAKADYLDFFKLVRQAEAESEVMIVANIRTQITGDGKLGLDFLARKRPEDWGKKTVVKVEGAGKEGSIPISLIDEVLELEDEKDE